MAKALAGEVKANSANQADARDDSDSFWSVSSYKVMNEGQTSTSLMDFAAPQDRYGQATSKEDGLKEEEDRPGEINDEDEWSMHKTSIKPDEIPFPWACASAVSKQVFGEGLHEVVVDLGSSGVLGFVDAAFVDERIKVAQHWVTESNIGRSWLLHSSGWISTGNKTTRVKHGKFAKGDRIRIRLDMFRGTASFSLGSGADRSLGSIDGIDLPVRLGFQMFHKNSWIKVSSYKDLTPEMVPKERAAGLVIRGDMFWEKSAPLRDGPPDTWDEFVKYMKLCVSAFDAAARAFSALQDATNSGLALEKYTTSKKALDATHALIEERFMRAKSGGT